MEKQVTLVVKEQKTNRHLFTVQEMIWNSRLIRGKWLVEIVVQVDRQSSAGGVQGQICAGLCLVSVTTKVLLVNWANLDYLCKALHSTENYCPSKLLLTIWLELYGKCEEQLDQHGCLWREPQHQSESSHGRHDR